MVKPFFKWKIEPTAFRFFSGHSSNPWAVLSALPMFISDSSRVRSGHNHSKERRAYSDTHATDIGHTLANHVMIISETNPGPESDYNLSEIRRSKSAELQVTCNQVSLGFSLTTWRNQLRTEKDTQRGFTITEEENVQNSKNLIVKKSGNLLTWRTTINLKEQRKCMRQYKEIPSIDRFNDRQNKPEYNKTQLTTKFGRNFGSERLICEVSKQERKQVLAPKCN